MTAPEHGRHGGRGSGLSAEAMAAEPALGLLMLAVPMWMERVRGYDEATRLKRAAGCGQVIASHGDALQFRDKHTEAAFNALAEGLACAAFQPGGVTAFGMHFCTGHAECLGAREAREAAGPPEDGEPPARPMATIDPGELL